VSCEGRREEEDEKGNAGCSFKSGHVDSSISCHCYDVSKSRAGVAVKRDRGKDLQDRATDAQRGAQEV
jgi:hypothetical protein